MRRVVLTRCPEPACISEALGAEAQVQGGRMPTAQVRAPGNPGHGQPIAPCAVGEELMRRFGIK